MGRFHAFQAFKNACHRASLDFNCDAEFLQDLCHWASMQMRNCCAIRGLDGHGLRNLHFAFHCHSIMSKRQSQDTHTHTHTAILHSRQPNQSFLYLQKAFANPLLLITVVSTCPCRRICSSRDRPPNAHAALADSLLNAPISWLDSLSSRRTAHGILLCTAESISLAFIPLHLAIIADSATIGIEQRIRHLTVTNSAGRLFPRRPSLSHDSATSTLLDSKQHRVAIRMPRLCRGFHHSRAVWAFASILQAHFAPLAMQPRQPASCLLTVSILPTNCCP